MKEIKLYAGDDGGPIVVSGAFGMTGNHCAGVIEDIIHVGGGERLVKYLGCNYSFKGVLERKSLTTIYGAKRIVSGVPRYLSNKWTLAFLVIAGIPGGIFLWVITKKYRNKVLMSFWEYFLEIAWRPIEKYNLAPTAYNQPIKEVYRAASKVITKHFKDNRVLDFLARTLAILCMILQFDFAYRSRFQDIFALLNKKLYFENPKKEIKRVFRIFLYRELSEAVKGTGKIMLLAVDVVMMSKKRRKIISDFVSEVDLEKIRMDEADWYFSLDRSDYNYGGISYEERIKIIIDLDLKMNNQRLLLKQETDGSITLLKPPSPESLYFPLPT